MHITHRDSKVKSAKDFVQSWNFAGYRCAGRLRPASERRA